MNFDDPDVERAAKQARALCRRIRSKLRSHGIDVVMGGSFVSGLAVKPRPNEPYDLDLRFLYDGDRKKVIPTIERETGLRYRKRLDTVHEGRPVDLHLIEGRVRADGIEFDVEGALRDTQYFGWQRLYTQVLTPQELRRIRAAKVRLRNDKKRYKQFKAAVLAEVQRRVRARGLGRMRTR